MGFLGFKNKQEKANTKTVMDLLVESQKKFDELYTKSWHPFDRIIVFFNATSKIQDHLELINAEIENLSGKEKTEAKHLFEFLSQEIKKAGRHPYGINRTKKGEHVTEHNVFLGDTHGLFTKNIADWKRTEYNDPNYKGTYAGTKLSYNPITEQANGFVNSHKELKTTINKLIQILTKK